MARTRGNLPIYVTDLLDAVREATGATVVLNRRAKLATTIEMQYGHAGREHRICYVEAFREHEAHILLNGAVKILRFWHATPDDQVIPACRPLVRLPPDLEDELARKTGSTKAMAHELGATLCNGAIQQLTATATDTRVERELFDEFHEHRQRQRLYWNRVLLETAHRVLPMADGYVPRRLSDAIVAMHTVYAQQLSELGAFDLGATFQSISCKPLVANLQEHLRGIETLGYKGDRLLADAWAIEMNMQDWYFWHRLGSAVRPTSESRRRPHNLPGSEAKPRADEPTTEPFSEWLF